MKTKNPKWSEIYRNLDYSRIAEVERLVVRGIQKDLAVFVSGEKTLWTELEQIAARYLSSIRSLGLAATYLYGVTFRQYGEYVEVDS